MSNGRDGDDREALPPSDRQERDDTRPVPRDGGDSPVPDSGRDNRPTSRGDSARSTTETGRPQRDERTGRHEPTAAGSLAEAVEQAAVQPTTVERRGLTATLVGVPRVALAEFVYDHQLDRTDEEQTRPVALFDLENTGDQPLRWRDARTSFVGSDDYTYRPAHVSLDPAQLGPGCHTRQVEIEPGRRARVVTLVEELPADVEVVEVVHTLAAGRGDDERLVFSVE